MNETQLLKKTRQKLGMSQQEFARLLGISRHQVSNYETGRTKVTGALVLKLLQIKKPTIKSGLSA